MEQSIKSSTHTTAKFRIILALAVIAQLFLTGSFILFGYSALIAANENTIIESEDGVLDGEVSIITETEASGGEGVVFGGTTTPPSGGGSGGGTGGGGSGTGGGSSGGTGGGGSETGGTPTMPTAATVGARCDTSTVVTPAQALTTLRSTGRISCVTINGMLSLEGTDGINWVIEDVRINSGSTYSLRTYRSGDPFAGTYAQRPIFRYVDLVGRGSYSSETCSSVIAAENVIIEYADIYGCSDGVKAWDNVTIRYSWVHDLDHPSGAHSDAVQIVRGVNIEFHGNRFDAYTGYSSDGTSELGGTGSGLLQTGSVTGDITATWTNNWFAGGHYTIRGSTDPRVSYSFRDNRFLRFGASVALGRTDLPPNRYGPVYGGVTSEEWINNVWDDTGELVQ